MRPNRFPVVLAVLLLLLAAGPASAETLREEIHRTFELSAGGAVDLSNVNGEVVVEAWDRDEVELHVEKKVKASSHEAAEEAMQAFRVEIDADADHLRVQTHKPRGEDGGVLGWLFGSNVQYSATYHVKVPRRADLMAESVNGAVRVEGVEGDVDAETVNGNVVLAGTSGDADVSTVNGGIEVREARGAVSASSVNGSVEVELTEVAAGAEMRFSTTNGGVRLALPADVRTHLEAHTTNGGIHTDFPVEVRGRHSKSVDADLNGGGGGQVTVRTTNGGIRIARL